MSVITIERNVLEKNETVAAENRALLRKHGIFCINIVSSPGAGKTTLLEQTIGRLKDRVPLAVIEGDIQTDIDARRVSALGIPAVQIVTRGGCHLDAGLVRNALKELKLEKLRLLIVENVGNLVCPANYDLGEEMKIVVASTTEGDDKPLKYPGIFLNSSVLIINKIDLLPYLPCDIGQLEHNALSVNPALKIFRTSCTTGAGVSDWCDWIEERLWRRG